VPPAYLSLQNVVKTYDGKTNAVDRISIDIQRGEFVALLGPSGSGKTTTLMMIAGFENPTSGAIELSGADITRRKPYERNIGVVFQNYALFPHMNVARNVGFPLRMRRFPKREIADRIDATLNLVGLRTLAERYPRELSGGQQQRVALARGLVFNPDLLLLDEPLGALDKHLREQMQTELKRIHREVGITMVYVTHDQVEAMTMADRVAVFNEGRLVQVAPPLDIYHRPATRFVGEFIGDANFLFGRIIDRLNCVVDIEGIGIVRSASSTTTLMTTGEVDVLVRPERIRLMTGNTGPRPEVVVDVCITAIVNYGDSLLIIGKFGGLDLRIRVAGDVPMALSEGTNISVGWTSRDMLLLPRS
jgi:putative spermidine/putrescine transport system ATP-binding protein